MLLIIAAIAVACVLVLVVSHVYYMVYDLRYLDEYCKNTFSTLDDVNAKSCVSQKMHSIQDNKGLDVSVATWTLTN
ncbi:MAG: hypothetical protein EKK57_00805 [Proteobacteria bacterium]|nr:MAG: hypothetical protein EKK57_00805 [Pseudomonadota bacterium]